MCKACLPDNIAFVQDAALGASAQEAADAAAKSLNKLGDMLNHFNEIYEAEGTQVCELAAEVLAQALISAIFTLAAASRSHGFVMFPAGSAN